MAMGYALTDSTHKGATISCTNCKLTHPLLDGPHDSFKCSRCGTELVRSPSGIKVTNRPDGTYTIEVKR